MQTKCPGCEKTLRLPDNAAGKKIKCPSCGYSFVLSEETQESQAALEAESKMKIDFDSKTLLKMLDSAKHDIDRSLTDRDEAMELVDKFFQLFLERAEKPGLPSEQQEEYREIAQQIFELQKRFPLLSSVKDALNQCENAIRTISA